MFFVSLALGTPFFIPAVFTQSTGHRASQPQNSTTTTHYLDPKIDVIFKILFANKNHKSILSGFSVPVFNKTVTKAPVLNPSVLFVVSGEGKTDLGGCNFFHPYCADNCFSLGPMHIVLKKTTEAIANTLAEVLSVLPFPPTSTSMLANGCARIGQSLVSRQE